VAPFWCENTAPPTRVPLRSRRRVAPQKGAAWRSKRFRPYFTGISANIGAMTGRNPKQNFMLQKSSEMKRGWSMLSFAIRGVSNIAKLPHADLSLRRPRCGNVDRFRPL
jgi:hypothetical protein